MCRRVCVASVKRLSTISIGDFDFYFCIPLQHRELFDVNIPPPPLLPPLECANSYVIHHSMVFVVVSFDQARAVKRRGRPSRNSLHDFFVSCRPQAVTMTIAALFKRACALPIYHLLQDYQRRMGARVRCSCDS